MLLGNLLPALLTPAPLPQLSLEPLLCDFLASCNDLAVLFFWLHWVFVAVCGLSSCRKWGLPFVVVHGLLIAVASLVVEHGLLGERVSVIAVGGLSSCGTRP